MKYNTHQPKYHNNRLNNIKNEKQKPVLKFRTYFPDSMYDLYDESIVGFNAIIEYEKEKMFDGETKWSLWVTDEDAQLYWNRFHEMERQKNKGQENWMQVDNEKFPTTIIYS